MFCEIINEIMNYLHYREMAMYHSSSIWKTDFSKSWMGFKT